MSLKFKITSSLPYCIRNLISRIFAWNRKRKARSVSTQLEDIRHILTYNFPIDRVPRAIGKLRLLQDGNKTLLAMFDKKCREHGLRYWLDYGTLLGAVRHKGFIPWDDDLDVSMMQGEYEKLLVLLPHLFPETEGFFYKKHAFLQIGFRGTPMNMDIFPYHFHSEQLDEPEKRHAVQSRIRKCKKSVVFTDERLNMNQERLETLIRDGIRNGQDAMPEEHKPGIYASPAITFFKEGAFSYESFFPLKTLEFEGLQLPVPNHVRQYLQFLYGDYMAYPPHVGYSHPSVEQMVKNVPFEEAVNRFIDVYEGR